MRYDYERKSFCLIRWAAYIVGLLFLFIDGGSISILIIGGAFALTGVGVRWEQSLAIRYGWYRLAWGIYYVSLLAFVIVNKGIIFSNELYLLLFLVPVIPEAILYEIKEYRGR